MAKKVSDIKADKKPGWLNQKEVCAGLEISTQAFAKWGVQPVSRIGRETFYSLNDIIENRLENDRKSYIQYNNLIEQEDVNPMLEKALLDKERRRGQALKNELAEGNLFPVVAGEYVFSKIGSEIAAVLDTLPNTIKRALPRTTATQMDGVKKAIAQARNSAVSVGERFDEFLQEYYGETDK